MQNWIASKSFNSSFSKDKFQASHQQACATLQQIVAQRLDTVRLFKPIQEVLRRLGFELVSINLTDDVIIIIHPPLYSSFNMSSFENISGSTHKTIFESRSCK